MLPEIQSDYYRELQRQAWEATDMTTEEEWEDYAEGLRQARIRPERKEGKLIIAIDPGTKTGCTITDGQEFKTILWNVAAKTKTKKRDAEPKYYRLMHLWNALWEYAFGCDAIVCEGAQGFMRGKFAIEASHKYRAVIELFGATNNIEIVMIDPNDLKQFALGKRSGSKEEMIAAANRMGYSGNEDNEADSYLLAKWFCKYRRKGG